MNIEELAALMGQSEADTRAFVDCLRVWTNKGYTLERAVERHMAQMLRLLERGADIPKSFAVEAFYQ